MNQIERSELGGLGACPHRIKLATGFQLVC